MSHSTHPSAGLFISFEGVDGAGKSSHIDALAQAFTAQGRQVLRTREPGGTPLAEKLRTLLLHDSMDPLSEALLVFAARRDHLVQVITPALARGEVVLCDRFTDATFAYQGGGRGVPFADIETLENWVQGSLRPDLTLLLDVPLEVSMSRIAQAREKDRFEQEEAAFFTRVRDAYLSRAAAAPERYALIDSNRDLALVRQSVEEALSRHFQKPA